MQGQAELKDHGEDEHQHAGDHRKIRHGRAVFRLDA